MFNLCAENRAFQKSALCLLTNCKICAKIIVQYYENVDEEGFSGTVSESSRMVRGCTVRISQHTASEYAQ